MDAIGVSRYLPVLVYRRGRPEQAAYIGYRLEAFENELGKFWTPAVKTAASGSVDAIKLAVEHVRGLGRGIKRIGTEASFLPAVGSAAGAGRHHLARFRRELSRLHRRSVPDGDSGRAGFRTAGPARGRRCGSAGRAQADPPRRARRRRLRCRRRADERLAAP